MAPPAANKAIPASLRTRRLIVGFGVLLLVDFLWVSSAELTRYIFIEETFNRPFFTTYTKTCMFMLYLLGFLFHRPWKEQCLSITQEDIEFEELEMDVTHMTRSLSDPMFEPINSSGFGSDSELTSDNNESTAENDPPDPLPSAGSGGSVSSSASRGVRFAKIHEVRRMPDCEAREAKFARLPYDIWLRVARIARRYENKLSVRNVAHMAAQFSLVWFVANYAYQAALADTPPGIVQVLSSTSALFTLILSAACPSSAADRLTLTKVVCVLVSLAGVCVVVYYDSASLELQFPVGCVWALVSSAGYAFYLVMLRRKVDCEDKLDIPMFFGFVGLFCFVFLWPGMYILHATAGEPFYPLPNSTQLAYIAVNGLVGTVLSEYLWLWGCFLTNSLIATLALSLTIPMTVIADSILWKESYPWMFFAGALPIVASFVCVTLLAHYDNCDPLLWLLRRCGTKLFGVVRRCCALFIPISPVAGRLRDLDREQTEGLLVLDERA